MDDIVKHSLNNLELRDYYQPSPLTSEVICCLCYKVFKQPVTLGCGHTFCRSCIGRWQKGTCPIDRIKYRPKNFNDNIILSKIIAKLPLYCPADAYITQDSASNDKNQDYSWLSHYLNCIKCEKELKNPVTVACGHTYCEKCLKGISTTGCVVDKIPIRRTKQYTKDIVIFAILKLASRSEIPLVREDSKTNSELDTENWENHVQCCWQIPITCACGEQIRKDLFYDEKTLCKCENLFCQFCEMKISKRCWTRHLDICPLEVMDCEHCDRIFQRKDKSQHDNVCESESKTSTLNSVSWDFPKVCKGSDRIVSDFDFYLEKKVKTET